MINKLFFLGILAALFASCSESHSPLSTPLGPPDPTRFTKEVFQTYLYEPTELVVLPNNKILFTERRGAIKQYDLSNGQFERYDSLEVFAKMEDGLMGIALDPEFDQNSWLYLYYSPQGERSIQQLSRFSYTPSGLANEKKLLEVEVQREECCHTGGSIEFGPDGLLYLSTGDDTNPFDANGYGPMDARVGRSAWDARRTSANTNDLRGKILRIKPEPDGSYSIPKGNLFEDNDPRTRPEIYVMGCRNPYRIAVDSRRGWLFWGDVGPDAGSDSPDRGPRGHDEFNVATAPGFYGWPLLVADNKPYRKYDFASGKSGEYYSALKPLNDSPYNSGLQELPPANPAKIFYPYANSGLFPQVKNGGRNAMAGPVYYSEEYVGRNKFPSFFDGRVFFFDWMRGFIYSLELDDQGNPTDWYPFMPDQEFNNVIDMAFGPDGQLYFIEYGTGWFTKNSDARLGRISYTSGNRPPVIHATASRQQGTAPLRVTFDASKSMDHDGDRLQYEWRIGGEKLVDSVFTFTFGEEGIYYPELILRDQKGNVQRKQFTIEVGNEAPEVIVALEGNKSFYWKGRSVSYDVKVEDLEDGKLGNGISPESVSLRINHYQSTDRSESLGHQSPVVTVEALLSTLDCKSCHKPDGPSIGPSYNQISQRYRNDPNAIAYLSNKVIKGGGGVWGEQAMSAHPELAKSDAEAIVSYILGMTKKSAHPLSGEFQMNKKEGQYVFEASYVDKGKFPLKPTKTESIVILRNHVMAGDMFDDSKDIQARNGKITSIYDQSWFMFKQIDLTDIASIGLDARGSFEGWEVTVRLGSPEGEPIGKVQVPEGRKFDNLSIPIAMTDGFADVFFIFSNSEEESRLRGISSISFFPKEPIL